MGKYWVDGLYYSKSSPFTIFEVKGETASWRNIVELDYPDLQKQSALTGTWTYGRFHETKKEIEEITGAKYYDIEMKFMGGAITMYGVLNEDGKSITKFSMLNELDEMLWLSPEKQKELLDDRQHEDTILPPNGKVQPENQGKILWLSGPPGAGKSTTAQYIAREKGWIYYEADCFGNAVDPFVPLDAAEPTLAQMTQKPIKVR